jgi:DNA mismatch endonuclease (patch repair protein)
MNIALRLSGGRGEYELAGTQGELRVQDLFGLPMFIEIPGRPDFIFPKPRAAVFVDGCFWHGCPKHGHSPKSNVSY